MTKEEKEFLIKVLSQITGNLSNPDSIESARLIQSIIGKLQNEEIR